MGNVEGDYTSVALFCPSSSHKVGEVHSCISSWFLLDATKLVWVEEAISYGVKLKSITDDLLYEFSCHIEEDNRSEWLCGVIWGLVGFWDDDQGWLFKMTRPVF